MVVFSEIMKLPKRLRSLFRKASTWAGPIGVSTALRGCPCPNAVVVPPKPFTQSVTVDTGKLDATVASWEAYCAEQCPHAASLDGCQVVVNTSEGNSRPVALECTVTPPTDLDADTWVSLCKSTCGEEQDCRIGPESTDGNTPTIRCDSWWTNCAGGRRTEGIPARAKDEPEDDVGRALAHLAALESASIPAFSRLRRELHALGAPRSLLREASRARRDEVRHARAVGALARRHGARLPNQKDAPSEARSIETIALENAVEGCVRETYGALVAVFQGKNARDPEVRGVMRRVAQDEARHAALAWKTHRWLLPRLSTEARLRVEAAMLEATRELRESLPAEDDHAAMALGVPRTPDLVMALGRTFVETN